MSLKKFIREKKKDLREIKNAKDLERAIGVISYARRTIKGTGEVLAPLRNDLKTLK